MAELKPVVNAITPSCCRIYKSEMKLKIILSTSRHAFFAQSNVLVYCASLFATCNLTLTNSNGAMTVDSTMPGDQSRVITTYIRGETEVKKK
jgi:hypothetical protein